MTASAKTVTTDSLAIKLFEADGGVAGEWHAQDECVRLFYRKRALEEVATSGGLEPPTSELEVPRSIQLS